MKSLNEKWNSLSPGMQQAVAKIALIAGSRTGTCRYREKLLLQLELLPPLLEVLLNYLEEQQQQPQR